MCRFGKNVKERWYRRRSRLGPEGVRATATATAGQLEAEVTFGTQPFGSLEERAHRLMFRPFACAKKTPVLVRRNDDGDVAPALQ